MSEIKDNACTIGGRFWLIYKEFAKRDEGEFNLPLLHQATDAACRLANANSMCNRMKSGELRDAFDRVVEAKRAYREALSVKPGKGTWTTKGEKRLQVLEAGGRYASAVRNLNARVMEYRRFIGAMRKAQDELSKATWELKRWS